MVRSTRPYPQLLLNSSGDDNTIADFEESSRRKLKLPPLRLRQVAKKRKIDSDSVKHLNDDPTASPAPKDENNVPHFLKSRPQVSKLQRDSNQDRKATTSFKSKLRTGEEASGLVHSDHFKGRADAWQQDESINDFLKRLPVTEPETAIVGPWLWVSSPQVNRQQREQRADIDAFVEIGEDLKEAFMKQRSKIESENLGKAVATITRKMGPYRDQLEEDFLSAAVKTGKLIDEIIPSALENRQALATTVETPYPPHVSETLLIYQTLQVRPVANGCSSPAHKTSQDTGALSPKRRLKVDSDRRPRLLRLIRTTAKTKRSSASTRTISQTSKTSAES